MNTINEISKRVKNEKPTFKDYQNATSLHSTRYNKDDTYESISFGCPPGIDFSEITIGGDYVPIEEISVTLEFCKPHLPTIKHVIYNDPATIVMWDDGTKTVVKASHGDVFKPEMGLAMAIVKKAYGNKGNYYKHIKKWLPDEA